MRLPASWNEFLQVSSKLVLGGNSTAKVFDAAVEEAHRVGSERNGLLEDYICTPSILRQSEGAQEYIRGDINNQIRKQREWLDLDRS